MRAHPRIAELTGMRKDSTSSINLAKLAFEGSKAETHLGRLLIWQHLDSSLVNGSSGGKTKVGSGFGDVVGEHL